MKTRLNLCTKYNESFASLSARLWDVWITAVLTHTQNTPSHINYRWRPLFPQLSQRIILIKSLLMYAVFFVNKTDLFDIKTKISQFMN